MQVNFLIIIVSCRSLFLTSYSPVLCAHFLKQDFFLLKSSYIASCRAKSRFNMNSFATPWLTAFAAVEQESKNVK